jgi:hypothetical protein
MMAGKMKLVAVINIYKEVVLMEISATGRQNE